MNPEIRSVKPPAGITTLDLLLFTAGTACGWVMHQASALRVCRYYMMPVGPGGTTMPASQLCIMPLSRGGFQSLLGTAWNGWIWAFVIGLAFVILGRRFRYDGPTRWAEWLAVALAIVLFESVYPAFRLNTPGAMSGQTVSIDPSSASAPEYSVWNFLNPARMPSSRPITSELWWPKKGESSAEQRWIAAQLAAAAAILAIAAWRFPAKLNQGWVALLVIVIAVLVTLGPIRLAEATSIEISSSAPNPEYRPDADGKPWSWTRLAAYLDARAWGSYSIRALALMIVAMLAARSLLTRAHRRLWTEWAAVLSAAIIAGCWVHDEFVARPALDRTARVLVLGTWLVVIAIIAGVSITAWGAIERRFQTADANGDRRSG